MNNLPTVSIVTPTYNRAESLRRTLEALALQAYPTESYEIIVVDDGSSDNTAAICESFDVVALRYLSQDHAGGTQAKNTGALASQSDLLVFLDDDITVVPQFIRCMVEEHLRLSPLIVVGTLHAIAEGDRSPHLLQEDSAAGTRSDSACISVELPFTDCLGGFFSLWRSDFLELGMLQDVAPGFWPNWEDVDFAYRASMRGFGFRRSVGAVGYHRDHVLADLHTTCDRWERAGRAAVFLFQRHPDLEHQIPMFRDKLPISWATDTPGLIARKLLRNLASCPPSMSLMQGVANVLEEDRPDSHLLVLLRRWLISAHIFRGYRQGLTMPAGKST